MKTLSVCMIVKNEESVIERCLKSAVGFADELIVVDTGSDDKTKELARRYTYKVYDYPWGDDFAAARNASYEKATCDYIMWLDADHVIEAEDADKINRLKETLTDERSILMRYESPENQMPLLLHMMMKRDCRRRWQGVVHERYPIQEPFLTAEITIHHRQKQRSNFIWRKTLILRLSTEEIQAHFWLAMQCYMDLVLAGDSRLAREYLELGLSTGPAYDEMISPCLVTGNILTLNRKWREALDAYNLLIAACATERLDDEGAAHRAVLSACLKAEKCAVKSGDILLAEQYNKRALGIEPHLMQAMANQLWFAGLRPVTISVCMIVKNEEPVIERCLKNAVRFADEIIVVDTGSDDRTKEIARRYTGKVYDYPWEDDFAAARNASYEKATCDYIMWLDADDDIEPESIEKIRQLKSRMPNADVVLFLYDGDPDRNHADFSSFLLRDRMAKRSLNPRWEYAIHEVIPIRSEWKLLNRPDIRMIHRKERVNEPGRNLRILNKLLAEGKPLDQYLRGYLCREYSENGEDEKAVEVFEKLLAGQAQAATLHYAGFFYIRSMKRLKQYAQLKERLAEVLQITGEDEMLLCAMGDACLKLREYAPAIENYHRAMAQPENPEDLRLHFPAYQTFTPLIRMAKAYSKLNDRTNAIRCFQAAESICPNDLEVRINKLFYEQLIRKEENTNE